MANHCSLRTNQKALLENWVSISKTRFPAASDKSRAAIRDHLPDLMELLCVVVETKVLESPEEASKIHGRQRHAFGDYTLLQVIGEYSILKNLVFDELGKEFDGVEMFRLVDLFFDAAISTAATEFTKLREEELLQAANKLKENNLDLERFAGVAAHDLRSPTATIVSYADHLIDSFIDDPARLKSAATISRTAKRMISLIDQLLVYARLGESKRSFSRVPLNQPVTDAVASLEAAVQFTDAVLEIDELPTIDGDAILLTQLFQNLIANSLKFKSEERTCRIKIEGRVERNQAVVEISDNGLGFHPDLSESIFVAFTRGHEMLPIQGSGIGLATVARIVKIHGGTVLAEGRENIGAKFTIRLPLVSHTQIVS